MNSHHRQSVSINLYAWNDMIQLPGTKTAKFLFGVKFSLKSYIKIFKHSVHYYPCSLRNFSMNNTSRSKTKNILLLPIKLIPYTTTQNDANNSRSRSDWSHLKDNTLTAN